MQNLSMRAIFFLIKLYISQMVFSLSKLAAGDEGDGDGSMFKKDDVKLGIHSLSIRSPKVAEVVKCLDTDFDSDSREFLTFHRASLSDIISLARLSSAGGRKRLKCNVHFLHYYLCQQPCRLDEGGGASVPCVAEPGPHPNPLDCTVTCSQPRLSGARAGQAREGREKVEAEAERMRQGTDTVAVREREQGMLTEGGVGGGCGGVDLKERGSDDS